jgi:hypothetical protein
MKLMTFIHVSLERKNIQWDEVTSAVCTVLSALFRATGSGLYGCDVIHINSSGANCDECSSFIKSYINIGKFLTLNASITDFLRPTET